MSQVQISGLKPPRFFQAEEISVGLDPLTSMVRIRLCVGSVTVWYELTRDDARELAGNILNTIDTEQGNA